MMNIFNSPTTKREPLWFEIDVPLDKAKVVARLDIMKLGGWKALESMSLEELDALLAEVDGAILSTGGGFIVGQDTDHNRTIFEAREAIKDQRFKVKREIEEKHYEQECRYKAIVGAADFIRQAVSLVEKAYSTERDPSFYRNVIPRPLEEIDTAGMSEYDLSSAIREYDDELQSMPAPDHSLFAMLKTPAAAAIADELKEINEVQQQRREMAMANRMRARDALDQLRAESAKSAARNEVLSSNLDEVIAELQSRIEELEASR